MRDPQVQCKPKAGPLQAGNSQLSFSEKIIKIEKMLWTYSKTMEMVKQFLWVSKYYWQVWGQDSWTELKIYVPDIVAFDSCNVLFS